MSTGGKAVSSVAVKSVDSRSVLSAGDIQLCHVWGHPLTFQAFFPLDGAHHLYLQSGYRN